jgi:hypothetical protein
VVQLFGQADGDHGSIGRLAGYCSMRPVKVLYPLGFSTDVRVRTLDNAG